MNVLYECNILCIIFHGLNNKRDTWYSGCLLCALTRFSSCLSKYCISRDCLFMGISFCLIIKEIDDNILWIICIYSTRDILVWGTNKETGVLLRSIRNSFQKFTKNIYFYYIIDILIENNVRFWILIILTSLFSTCRPYRDRQKPDNGTRCHTLKADS